MLQVVPTSDNRFVPLKSVTIHVDIRSFAADVCIQQVFINSESSPIEAVYCFPIEEQATIYEFKASLEDGREIQAQIKEKKTAQREYCASLRKGHGAFLLEQDEKSNDVFTISVGKSTIKFFRIQIVFCLKVPSNHKQPAKLRFIMYKNSI